MSESVRNGPQISQIEEGIGHKFAQMGGMEFEIGIWELQISNAGRMGR
jgi:hypothetical protein